MTDFLLPPILQHARLLCPPPSPRVCSDSCSSRWWWYLTVSSSAAPFSFCRQSFPASGSSPMSQLSASRGQSPELQLQQQSLQWMFRIDFLQDWLHTGTASESLTYTNDSSSSGTSMKLRSSLYCSLKKMSFPESLSSTCYNWEPWNSP